MLAIIGGSGLYALKALGEPQSRQVKTDYAADAVAVQLYTSGSGPVAFIPRHGQSHRLPPHRVNYRANIAALAELGVEQILAINAVGGITAAMGPGALLIPDQIIDYTHGRESTFFDENLTEVVHVDFSQPFTSSLSHRLASACEAANQSSDSPRSIQLQGVYGCTQGPRLETAAEINRMQQDGCDVVGMTAMPEAVLAREKGMDYAMLALSVNWAAGIVPGTITMADIQAVMNEGMGFVHEVISRFLSAE